MSSLWLVAAALVLSCLLIQHTGNNNRRNERAIGKEETTVRSRFARSLYFASGARFYDTPSFFPHFSMHD